MTEMKEATIFDPNAHIEAIAIRFDTGSETWELQSIGTVEECRASCDRARSKGCEHEMRLYRVGMWVPDRSQHGNHGTIEGVQRFDRALTPDEIKELATQDADARRYRWLREQNASILRHTAYRSDAACHVEKTETETEDDWTDRTVDAAMNDNP